ncbi:hypothetical protein [Sinorhizobium meliloti]|uniref:hypothetical protein n=1 Tax=Rhizobium meliloti TaxID=382 RepID=UPI000B4A4984|nr:hypothetical protein [Sinorhizobium meliloti]ASP90299.1 hypothetical protein CDO25_03250 [Sinorhizobium meliloti]MQX59409.1 hypothetical protein [Sinorhizobium meliloti]
MPAEYLECELSEIEIERQRCNLPEFNEWFEKSPLKSRVKKKCMQLQQLRCCYCKQYTNSTNNNLWDLEHILCEEIYPEFFVEPLNLAVACKRCNGAKSRKDVLADIIARPPQSVPNQPQDYTVPHPHLTIWDEHLRQTLFILYEGKTPQGENLIDVCELNGKAEEKAGARVGTIKAAIEAGFFERYGVTLPDDVGGALDAGAFIQHLLDNDGYDALAPKLEREIRDAGRKAVKRRAAREAEAALQGLAVP